LQSTTQKINSAGKAAASKDDLKQKIANASNEIKDHGEDLIN